MSAYIENSISKGAALYMTGKARENLQSYAPRGCPFKDYTLYDLVSDWLNMYAWKITGKMSLTDFVRLLQSENYAHAVAYGDAVIKIIEEV